MKAMGRRALISVLLTLLAGCTVYSSTFVHGPYSGAPSEDSVTISWLCSPPVPARIEYGPRVAFSAQGALPYSLAVPATAEDPRYPTTHVLLGGLLPTTEYVYRVVLIEEDVETESPIGSFRTEPDPGEPVSFAVIADTQWQWEGTDRLELVGDAIASDPTPFDFVLHAGDVVESPSSYYWDHWFSSFDEMLLRSPFLPVLGNHERNHRSYYDAFSLPPGAGKNDEQWWALHWGDVVVVGLDTNVSRVADYHAQQDWAREHLSGPESHKFVIFHHPVFSSDAFHGSGYSYDLIYHPIFVEHGVDIVFNGHAHNYERLERDGIVYLVLGGGGATPRALAEEHVTESVRAIEGHYFYARVEMVDGTIDVDIISVAREPVDGGKLTIRTRRLDAFTPGVTGTVVLRSPPWVWLAVAAVGGLVALLVSRLVSE
jgi:predicted phosphodiesterase